MKWWQAKERRRWVVATSLLMDDRMLNARGYMQSPRSRCSEGS